MSNTSKVKLGKILLKQKLVSSEELDSALTDQKENGNARLASKLLEKGIADEQKLLEALATQHEVQPINLDELEISLICLEAVPKEIAQKQLVLPVWTTFETIHLAMANPGDQQAIGEVELLSGKKVIPLVTLQTQIKSTIDACYDAYISGQQVYRGPKVSARDKAISELDMLSPKKEKTDVSNI